MKTKAQISFAVTAKLISAFVFVTRTVQFLYFLNPKFPVSRHLLCLYSPVCVGPVRKPHCWFSHEAAHLLTKYLNGFVKILSQAVSFSPLLPACCIGSMIKDAAGCSCNMCRLHSYKCEHVHEKTNHLEFRPGPTQTGLYSHRSRLDS